MSSCIERSYYRDQQGREVIDKDDDEKLDYPFDLSKYLTAVGDTIASVQWLVDTTLVVDLGKSGNDTLHATVWVSGGTVGKKQYVTCKATTAAGRIVTRTIWLNIVQRRS